MYNAEKYLHRAVESVLIQRDVKELIIVEDGSTDDSLRICRRLATTDQRIVILQHPGNKNYGVSVTRNLGIKRASSEFVAFLDADDYYLPDRFVTTKQRFDSDPSIDGVYEIIGLRRGSPEIKPHTCIQIVAPDELFENLAPLGDKLWFHINGLTVKRQVFNQAGFFDESLRTSEDTLQWLKMAATTTLVNGNITYPVAVTEKHPEGLSADRTRVQKDFILMLFKLFKWCKKINCKRSRKELVMRKLFGFSFSPLHHSGANRFDKILLLLKLITADPTYVLFRSSTFRHYASNLVGYHRALYFMKKIASRA